MHRDFCLGRPCARCNTEFDHVEKDWDPNDEQRIFPLPSFAKRKDRRKLMKTREGQFWKWVASGSERQTNRDFLQ